MFDLMFIIKVSFGFATFCCVVYILLIQDQFNNELRLKEWN